MKNFIIILVVLVVVVGIGGYLFTQGPLGGLEEPQDQQTPETSQGQEEQGETEEEPVFQPETVIGTSAENRAITAYHYGEGDTELLFIGGFHGGYSWNTVLLAYELMDHLEAAPSAIPSGVKVTVIPVFNPDGLNQVVGTTGRFTATDVPSSQAETIPGRFNANNVDLNRNFDCDWQATGTWQSRQVSGGTRAFSEPESQALRGYIENNRPAAVVIWYSAAGGVFASGCTNILPETRTIMTAYADASGYPAYDKFDFYEITGDAANWLAQNNIPAFSVVLSDHQNTEWTKNRAGIEALLDYYAE